MVTAEAHRSAGDERQGSRSLVGRAARRGRRELLMHGHRRYAPCSLALSSLLAAAQAAAGCPHGVPTVVRRTRKRSRAGGGRKGRRGEGWRWSA